MTPARRLAIGAPVVLFALSWPLVDPAGFASDPLAAITDAATGWILVAAGLVAWSRRPDASTGRWLVAAGYLWYVGDLYFVFPSASLVPLASFAFRGAYDALIAAVLLSFPGSWLSSTNRAAVGAIAVAYAARALAFLATARPGYAYPDNGTPNPFLLTNDGALARNLDLDLTMVNGSVILLVGLLALARMPALTSATRRVVLPVVAGGIVWASLTFLGDLDRLVDANFHVVLLPWTRADWWSVPEYLLRGSAAPVGFLAGALLLRTARSAVVELVTGLEREPLRVQLEPSLRRVLGDPSLRVAYPDPAGGTGWLDGAGDPAVVPEPSARAGLTPVVSNGVTRAMIVHDPALLEDPGLVSAIAATVRLAVDNEALTAALEGQLDETRASRRRIVEAGDAERQRIERDLHDGAQQRLVSLAIALRLLGDSLGEDASSAIRDELSTAEVELRGAIEELRELAHGVDPAILRESGLGPAVRALAERCPTPTRVDLQLDGRLPRAVEVTAYFLVAEALANVTKHAAASAVTVRLRAASGRLLVEVEDDGSGGAEISRGTGLRGLTDRVAAAGGHFDLGSGSRGGTRVAADLPIAT